MVSFIACKCSEGEGLPHSHIGRRTVYETTEGREARLDDHTAALNADRVSEWKVLRVEEPTIRMWIDWKAVAKAVMQ